MAWEVVVGNNTVALIHSTVPQGGKSVEENQVTLISRTSVPVSLRTDRQTDKHKKFGGIQS